MSHNKFYIFRYFPLLYETTILSVHRNQTRKKINQWNQLESVPHLLSSYFLGHWFELYSLQWYLTKCNASSSCRLSQGDIEESLTMALTMVSRVLILCHWIIPPGTHCALWDCYNCNNWMNYLLLTSDQCSDWLVRLRFLFSIQKNISLLPVIMKL